MHDSPSFLTFGSRTDREDAALVSKVISFAARGKIWTLVIEDVRTTRYRRRANERYLRANLMLGAKPPEVDLPGELLPDHTSARVTSARRGPDGTYELILAVSLECAAGRVGHAA